VRSGENLLAGVTAVLLCGGKGERLRPFTDSLPKALVPLNGRPLLHHLLRSLEEGGVQNFVLCTGYRAQAIEDFLRAEKNGAGSGAKITCVNSGEDAAMADRVLDALPHVFSGANGRALICYGDTMANVDLAALAAEHQQAGTLATITVYPLHSPFGIVEISDGGSVRGIAEKPVLPHWVNIGYLLCERAAFQHLRRGDDLAAFAAELARGGQLHAFRHAGRHVTVNTEKERSEAEAHITEFFTVLENPAAESE
jgi:glucose-1-phosphate cytidylyltransferase